jgi:hypothetical protein
MTNAMEAISASKEIYHPSAEVIAQANVPDYLELRPQAIADPVAFWDARAKEVIDWYEPYQQVLDSSTAPFFKWFVGGKTNIVHNALDRHVQEHAQEQAGDSVGGRGRRAAHLSYFELWREVNRFANVLKAHGRQAWRHRHDLHGPHPGAHDCHAGLRQDWGHSLRRLRRLLESRRSTTASRQCFQGAGHVRRRLAARRDRRTQEDRRRGVGQEPPGAEVSSSSSAPGRRSKWWPTATTGGTT